MITARRADASAVGQTEESGEPRRGRPFTAYTQGSEGHPAPAWINNESGTMVPDL